MNDQSVAVEMPATEIDGGFVPTPRPGVTAVVLDGEAVLLASGSANAHYLNEIGTIVWDTFDGAATLDELAADFAEVFGAEVDVVRDDVLALARQIGRAGLLEGVTYEPPPETSPWPAGVAVGEPIPSFTLQDVAGAAVELADLSGRRLLLINWSPFCDFCAQITPELAALQAGLRARDVDLVFITKGGWEENRPMFEEHGLAPKVLLQRESETEVFAGVGTPAAYLVDPEGRAASELTVGADQVPSLVRSAAGREIPLIG